MIILARLLRCAGSSKSSLFEYEFFQFTFALRAFLHDMTFLLLLIKACACVNKDIAA